MNGMTVDEAIRALTEMRRRVGGDAPLVTPDWNGLRLKEPMDGEHCVYATDVGTGGEELEPAISAEAVA
jgi:hypothetical protein